MHVHTRTTGPRAWAYSARVKGKARPCVTSPVQDAEPLGVPSTKKTLILAPCVRFGTVTANQSKALLGIVTGIPGCCHMTRSRQARLTTAVNPLSCDRKPDA